MLRFYYNKAFKYTNRRIIASSVLSNETYYKDINYLNIDSPDSITGHIIYIRADGEELPTYIKDSTNEQLWYVSGITQLRTGKYQLSLIRDILSEVPYNWKNERAFINAGIAAGGNYNQYKTWNLPYTNTKLSANRLNINGPSSYFVFYVNGRALAPGSTTEYEEKNLSLTGSITQAEERQYDLLYSSLDAIPGYSQYASKANPVTTAFTEDYYMEMYRVYATVAGQAVTTRKITSKYTKDMRGSSSINTRLEDTQDSTHSGAPTSADKQNRIQLGLFPNNDANTTTGVYNFLNGNQVKADNIEIENYRELLSLNGKVIKENLTGNVYLITIDKGSTTQTQKQISTSSGYGVPLVNNIWNAFINAGEPLSTMPETNGNWGIVFSNKRNFTITTTLLQSGLGYDFNLRANLRKLPNSGVRCVNIVAGAGISSVDLEAALQLAQTNPNIVEDETGKIIDIQKLPFSVANTQNSDILINGVSCIAKFLDIDNYDYNTSFFSPIQHKETTTFKFISPSSNSQFLFKPDISQAGLTQVNTKITIKPFQTTIYVRPSTVGLLMQDFNDKNCLIIQEDMSLTKITDSWTNYILQNKNLNATFNRQMQGRELEQSWERRVEQAQAKADVWNARNISADRAKTYTGNLPIIGNVAGAIGTGFQNQDYMEASRLDREYAEALRQESMSMARDMFKLQNDNIKSQPPIPTTLSGFDVKTLDGIYVEVWGTNPTELQGIRDYYENNGNRIDDYGTFEEYYGDFVRGYIIQSEYYTQPEINEINVRLQTGIYAEEGWNN